MTEEIGTESRGLSDELISYLPSSTYKIGLFSKKDKHDEYVSTRQFPIKLNLYLINVLEIMQIVCYSFI